eukprot:3750921-Pleurochrysis_carterae.AAC.1
MSGGSSSTSDSSASCSGSAIYQDTAALLLSPAQQVSAGHIWHGNLRFGAVSMVPYARRLWKTGIAAVYLVIGSLHFGKRVRNPTENAVKRLSVVLTRKGKGTR